MTEDTYKIPRWFVGFVTTFIVLTIPWCAWVTQQLMNKDVEFAVKVNSTYIEELKKSQWTIAMQSELALRTAILNPGLKLPDPRDTNKVIVVMKGNITYDPNLSNINPS